MFFKWLKNLWHSSHWKLGSMFPQEIWINSHLACKERHVTEGAWLRRLGMATWRWVSELLLWGAELKAGLSLCWMHLSVLPEMMLPICCSQPVTECSRDSIDGLLPVRGGAPLIGNFGWKTSHQLALKLLQIVLQSEILLICLPSFPPW